MNAHVLSFGKVVPHENIEHAGGKFYYLHMKALTDLGFVCTVVAPDEPRNRQVVERELHDGRLSVVLVESSRRGAFSRLTDKVRNIFAGATPGAGYLASLKTSNEVQSLILQSDVVDLQWFENFSVIDTLDLKKLRKPIIGFAHDIVSQRIRRMLRSNDLSWFRYARESLRLWHVERAERRLFSEVDRLCVFSEKDAGLARAATDMTITVVSPPLGNSFSGSAADAEDRNLRALFVGAFNRLENEDAAVWLIGEIWPLVLDQHPRAVLTVAGAHPSSRMLLGAETVGSVEVTGFVDDLDCFYNRASVVIVPLRQGAGVKFKTIEAVLRKVPVVGTSIGMEGVEIDGEVAGVAEHPAEIANRVCDVFNNPLHFREAAALLALNCQAKFGHDQFVASLRLVYGEAEAISR